MSAVSISSHKRDRECNSSGWYTGWYHYVDTFYCGCHWYWDKYCWDYIVYLVWLWKQLLLAFLRYLHVIHSRFPKTQSAISVLAIPYCDRWGTWLWRLDEIIVVSRGQIVPQTFLFPCILSSCSNREALQFAEDLEHLGQKVAELATLSCTRTTVVWGKRSCESTADFLALLDEPTKPQPCIQ